jgi:NAD(P)-dependent dehydrogenase (short-subunit alcohol dehydrogenase family)
MKRIAQPEEVAHALLFLVHPLTSFTTGATFPVDGGLSCLAPELETA